MEALFLAKSNGVSHIIRLFIRNNCDKDHRMKFLKYKLIGKTNG